MYCVCLSVCNYSIPTASGNVVGAYTLAGAGIVNCLNFTYNRPLLMLLILLLILGFGVEFPQLYIHDSYPDCQFVGLTYTGRYCFHVLLRPEREQLQNYLHSALAEFENWLKASKHTNLNHMCTFIHSLACAECDDSLPFLGASSILLCCVLFPSHQFPQLVFHPSLLRLAICFLVCL